MNAYLESRAGPIWVQARILLTKNLTFVNGTLTVILSVIKCATSGAMKQIVLESM